MMPRSYSLGKRELMVALTRAAIIDGFLYLMARSPYDSIAIKQIAQEADVAEKTVRRHFRSKDAVFVAFAEDAVGRVQQSLLRSVKGGTARSAVQELVAALYSAYEACSDRMSTFITVAQSGSQDVARSRAAVRASGRSLAESLVGAWPGAWRFDADRTRQILSGMLSFTGWRLLREECGLSAEEAVFAASDTIGSTLMKPVESEQVEPQRVMN